MQYIALLQQIFDKNIALQTFPLPQLEFFQTCFTFLLVFRDEPYLETGDWRRFILYQAFIDRCNVCDPDKEKDPIKLTGRNTTNLFTHAKKYKDYQELLEQLQEQEKKKSEQQQKSMATFLDKGKFWPMRLKFDIYSDISSDDCLWKRWIWNFLLISRIKIF